MNAPAERKSPFCAAFGCPLFGAMSTSTQGDGKWFCCCHFGKAAAVNDAITARLNSDKLRPIAMASRDLREFSGTDDWGQVEAGIIAALVKIGRPEIVMNREDRGYSGYLARLETVLVDATRDAGTQTRIPSAPVVGPTHAPSHPYAGAEA